MSGTRGSNYQFRISATGFQEFYRDMSQLAQSSEVANRALETLVRSSPQLAAGFVSAADATERAARAQRELAAAQERASAVVERSAAPVRGLGDQLGALESRTLAARRGVGDLRGALELLGASGVAGALGPVGGAIGNVADLLGTASTAAGAFRVGMSTMLGVLAPVGLAVGAVATAAGLLNIAYEAQADRTRQAREANEAYQRALDASNGLLQTAEERSRAAADARLEEARAAITLAQAIERENVARINEAASRATATRGRLQDAVDSGRAAPGQVAGGLERANQAALGLAQQAQQAADRLAELDVRLAGINNQPRGPVYGPELPPGFRAPRTTSGTSGSGRATATPDPIIYESGQGTVFPLMGTVDALSRASDIQAQQEERARQQRERAEREYLDRIERENERSTDSIVRYAGDAFADMFSRNSRGWAGLMETFRSTATSTFARIAAEAVLRPVIAPIVAGVNGLFSADGSAGGGGGGGSILGTLGQLGQLRSFLPDFGGVGLVGGVTQGINSAASSLFPSVFTSTGAGNIAGALPSTNLANLQPLTGSPMGTSFTGTVGGIGAGFAAGSIISSFTASSGPRQTNGNIGAGIGAVAGSIFGPVGSIIGGAAGGFLGSLIGPGNGFSGGAVNVGVTADGRLVSTNASGKRFDLGGLRSSVDPQLEQANAQLAALGLRFTTGEVGVIAAGEAQGPRDVGQLISNAPLSRIEAVPGNDRLRTALTRVKTTDEALAAAQFVQQFDQIVTAGDPVAEFNRSLKQLTDSFAEARREAERLGLDTTKLTEAQARQTAELERARDANNGRAAANSLLEQLTFGQGSILAPEQRGFAALQAINSARRSVDGTQGLDEFSRVFASAFPVVQDVFGVSGRTTAVLQDAANILGAGDTTGLARLLESQSSGTTQLSDTFAAYGGATVSALENLRSDINARLDRLSAEISGVVRRIA